MRAGGQKVFCFEGCTLDLKRGSLRTENCDIELRPKSFALLRYLVENAGRLVPKDELIKAVWPKVIVTDELLARCVSDVRKALGDADQRIVKTMTRRGYLFASPVTSHPVHVEEEGFNAPAAALPDKPSIAVLPFKNMSGDRAGVLRRWRRGRNHHGLVALPAHFRNRTRFELHLQRTLRRCEENWP